MNNVAFYVKAVVATLWETVFKNWATYLFPYLVTLVTTHCRVEQLYSHLKQHFVNFFLSNRLMQYSCEAFTVTETYLSYE